MAIIATHKSKAVAKAEAKEKNKRSKVFRFTVRKSKYVKGHWNVVKVRKTGAFGF